VRAPVGAEKRPHDATFLSLSLSFPSFRGGFPLGEKSDDFLHLLKEKSRQRRPGTPTPVASAGCKREIEQQRDFDVNICCVPGGVFKRRDAFLGVKNPAVSLLFLRDCREFKSVPTVLSGTMRGQKRWGKEETYVRFSEFNVGRGFPRPRVRVGDEKREESDGGNHIEEE
jgi:hypothetical protein